MTLRLGVTGATGRMGGEVLAEANDREDCEVVFAVSRSGGTAGSGGSVETVHGVEVESADEFDALVVDREPNAIVDFSAPDAAIGYARACADGGGEDRDGRGGREHREGTGGVAFVTGTTGFDEAEREALDEVSESIPVLKAPNFARGVQALVNVVGDAVRSLPGYDVELVETHHNGKRDAPSGTANRLLDEIEENGDFTGRAHGRVGDQPREAGEIGVHAVRAGNVTGEHEIVIAGNHEEVRLTHRAEDRGVFAAGALDAAAWLAGRDPGRYDFAAVIDE